MSDRFIEHHNHLQHLLDQPVNVVRAEMYQIILTNLLMGWRRQDAAQIRHIRQFLDRNGFVFVHSDEEDPLLYLTEYDLPGLRLPLNCSVIVKSDAYSDEEDVRRARALFEDNVKDRITLYCGLISFFLEAYDVDAQEKLKDIRLFLKSRDFEYHPLERADMDMVVACVQVNIS